MSPEVHTELLRLLSALCDDRLTADEHARLDELLAGDPECRRAYLEYLDVHARLASHPQLGAPGVPVPTASGFSVPQSAAQASCGRRTLRHWQRYVLVAASTLAASLLVQVLLLGPTRRDAATPPTAARTIPTYVATLIQAEDCVWDAPGEPIPAGARLLPGDLRLRHGVARVRFDGGPVLTLEGSTVLPGVRVVGHGVRGQGPLQG